MKLDGTTRLEDRKEISKEDLETALNKSCKWKSPGIDKMSNFWLHVLSKGHSKVVVLLIDTVKIPEKAPEWLSEGAIYLLPKKNYRYKKS